MNNNNRSLAFRCVLLLLALRSCRSELPADSSTTSAAAAVQQRQNNVTAKTAAAAATTTTTGHQRQNDVITDHNSTVAATSSAERGDVDDTVGDGQVDDRRYVEPADDDGGSAALDDDGSAAELYEDLEDSVVFEDTAEAGGRSLQDGETSTAASGLHGDGGNDQQLPNNATAADQSSSGTEPDAQEYDEDDDATAAGSSPAAVEVRHWSAKYPEYVRSSSYRRGWPGGNVTRPEELFRFWDPYEWTDTSSVSDQCADHMEQYQTALRNGNMWAYKSECSPEFSGYPSSSPVKLNE